MPGPHAQVRSDPSFAIQHLEHELPECADTLRQIVTGVCDLGPCQIGDPNSTRALAIQAIDKHGRSTPQFFAIITDQHKGCHSFVGPIGFSIQIAFQPDSGLKPLGADWDGARFDYTKHGKQVWWRYDVPNRELDVACLLKEVVRARQTWLVEL